MKNIIKFVLLTLTAFSFSKAAQSIDIKLWDLSGRDGQDEFYELLQKEVKKYKNNLLCP